MTSVVVLKDGVYNNPHHRAVVARAGDVIEVAGDWYAASLIADGFVKPYEELEPEPALAEEAPKPKRRGRKRKSR